MTTFTNHRGVVPMLWAFLSLAVIELLVVHFFVALKWPWVGWPLSALTLLSILWLLSWVRSWSRLPHELHSDFLRFHMGSLRHVDVPLKQIIRIVPVESAEQLKGRNCRNLVPLAFPNRLIVLKEPMQDRRRTTHIAVRFDDPAAFDAACSAELPSRIGLT